MAKDFQAPAACGPADDVLPQVREALWEAAVVVKVRRKDLLKWPDDEEALHQYRISIRVARSLVKFLRPYMARGCNDELKALLKELQDPTSRMRELDVLVPQLERWPDLQEQVRAVQAATRGELVAGLKAPEAQQVHAQVESALKQPSWKKAVRRDGIARDALAGRVEARRALCEETLETIDFADQEAVHDLRKQAKALRYVVRELKGCLPPDAGKAGSRMREVQDKLGEWCDARVGAAIIREVCGEPGRQAAAAFQAQADAIVEGLKAQGGPAGA